MALSAEVQVKRDLGVPIKKRKKANFSKLFEMPPHTTYTARDQKTAKRLRRLVGSNIISLTDWEFMQRLEDRTVEVHVEDLQERMDMRASEAAAAEHLRLWEEVLRGKCTLPLESLDDECMRDIRQQQLKLEGLQQKAKKLGTTFQRVITQPKVWSPPTDKWDRMKKMVQERLSIAERTQSAADRKSADTTGQFTICSLGEFFNRLSGASQMGEAITQQRRRRAKSLETESEYPVNAMGRLGSARLSVNPRSSQQPQPQTQPQPQECTRSARRVMPEKRKPVVYPAEPPRCLLLSAEGGKHVLGPPANPDYIIPKYFVPKALDHLRRCENLEALFVKGDELFEAKYPPDDNRCWNAVSEHLKEARDQERGQPSPDVS